MKWLVVLASLLVVVVALGGEVKLAKPPEVKRGEPVTLVTFLLPSTIVVEGGGW
ncbi:MAG: hypothetical protein WAP74_04245 [Patescibacteria group bacterium]